MKYVCFCGKSFDEYSRYDYYEHKRGCKLDVEQAFRTIRLRIHSVDHKAHQMKKKLENLHCEYIRKLI